MDRNDPSQWACRPVHFSRVQPAASGMWRSRPQKCHLKLDPVKEIHNYTLSVLCSDINIHGDKLAII